MDIGSYGWLEGISWWIFQGRLAGYCSLEILPRVFLLFVLAVKHPNQPLKAAANALSVTHTHTHKAPNSASSPMTTSGVFRPQQRRKQKQAHSLAFPPEMLRCWACFFNTALLFFFAFFLHNRAQVRSTQSCNLISRHDGEVCWHTMTIWNSLEGAFSGRNRSQSQRAMSKGAGLQEDLIQSGKKSAYKDRNAACARSK